MSEVLTFGRVDGCDWGVDTCFGNFDCYFQVVRVPVLGFVRVSPMPRPESDRDFSDPVVFGHGKVF
jgi:hypothetical protein